MKRYFGTPIGLDCSEGRERGRITERGLLEASFGMFLG